MSSPRGTSSGSSSMQQNSSSEEEMQVQMIDERKRKRMQSNRESARRSRMRKQKHLDDLTAQVSNLRKMNNQIIDNIKLTTQDYIKIESDNSIIRAQMSELNNRLQSLNEIITNVVLGSVNNQSYDDLGLHWVDHVNDHLQDFLPMIQQQQLPLYNDCFFSHPIMASTSSMFHC